MRFVLSQQCGLLRFYVFPNKISSYYVEEHVFALRLRNRHHHLECDIKVDS